MSFTAPAAANVLQSPTTWQAVSLGAGLVSAGGSKNKGSQEQAAYETNAMLFTQQAAAEKAKGEINSFRKRKNLEGAIGTQQAMYAARGVSPVSGSPIDVMVEDLANGNLDIAIDNYNSDVASRNYEYQADLARYYGEQSQSQGSTVGGTTLLKSAADFGLAMTKNKIGKGG